MGFWDKIKSGVAIGAEDLAGFISPRWALERAQTRAAAQQLESLGSFHSANDNRLTGHPRASVGRADFHLEITYDRRKMVDHARELERNSVIAEGMLSRSVENVIGTGYTLRAQSKNPEWNRDVQEKWKLWSAHRADVRGLSTFNELLALTYRSWLRDGDVGAIKLADGRLQFVESDQIANPQGNIPDRTQIDGILLDKRGQPKTFLVVTEPDPQWASVRFGQKFTAVPAEHMIFMARRQRHGQTRGLSAFNNVTRLLDQIDGHIEATTVAARMAACVGLVITRANKSTGLNRQLDSQGNSRRAMTIEPGFIGELQHGDTITTVDPKQPTESFPDFLASLGRLVGLSFGLPLEIAFLDFSRTNYSSARASILQAHKGWERNQEMMGRFASKVYEWWIIREMKAGRIAPRRDALKHSWRMPKWKWVDPTKEFAADMAAVDAGLLPRADLAEKFGYDWAELQPLLKKEQDTLLKLELPQVRSQLTRDYVDPIALAEASKPPEGADDSEDKGEDDDKKSDNKPEDKKKAP